MNKLLLFLILLFGGNIASAMDKSYWILKDEPLMWGGGIKAHFVDERPEIGPGFIFGLKDKKSFLKVNYDKADIFVPLCSVDFSVEVDNKLKGELGRLSVEKIRKMDDVPHLNIAEDKVILKTGYLKYDGDGIWGKEEWEYLRKLHKKDCPGIS